MKLYSIFYYIVLWYRNSYTGRLKRNFTVIKNRIITDNYTVNASFIIGRTSFNFNPQLCNKIYTIIWKNGYVCLKS